nr:hypothetical protein [Elizabethkingia sp. ASV34]
MDAFRDGNKGGSVFSSFNPNPKGYYRRNNDFVFSETKRVKEFQGAKKNATT